jgi:hypothetical protein
MLDNRLICVTVGTEFWRAIDVDDEVTTDDTTTTLGAVMVLAPDAAPLLVADAAVAWPLSADSALPETDGVNKIGLDAVNCNMDVEVF